MKKKTTSFYTRSNIWIQDADGNVIFGFGRVRILRAIQRTGSIHAAAKELRIGYRAIWGRIKATEERMGEKLLTKTIGGAKGGGSRLTPLAEALLLEFDKARKHIEKETDKALEKRLGTYLPLNK